MSIHLSPYLVFSGESREALEFYKSVFGGELQMITFGSMGDPGEFPAEALMHGQLNTDAGWSLMAADSTKPDDEVVRGGSSLCVWGDNEQEMARQFEALSVGGTVSTPLVRQPWGDIYGELTDRFGISWGFNIGSTEIDRG